MNKLEKEEWKFIFLLLKITVVGILFVLYGNYMEKEANKRCAEMFNNGIECAIMSTSVQAVDVESGEVTLTIDDNDYTYYYYTK